MVDILMGYFKPPAILFASGSPSVVDISGMAESTYTTAV